MDDEAQDFDYSDAEEDHVPHVTSLHYTTIDVSGWLCRHVQANARLGRHRLGMSILDGEVRNYTNLQL